MNVQVLGISDEVTTCECCGRSSLKRTIAMSFDGAAPTYYGTNCAARATGNPDIAKVARKELAVVRRRLELERQADAEAEIREWLAWVSANGTGASNFERIQSLGGFTAARRRWRESQ